MAYDPKYFNPARRGTPVDKPGEPPTGRVLFTQPGDTGPGASYVYDPSLMLAINVALATRRPLLLAGEPGCGKTSVARNIALHEGWAYYPHTLASRSQADELLFEMDTLRRLNEAQARQRVRDEAHFVEPGVLWWALAPASAARRGLPEGARGLQLPQPPAGHRAGGSAVVLVDEIDKCEPDVPNDLLEVMDTRRFSVRGQPVVAESARPHVLVVITTNVERDLPGAFVRRCVTYRFPDAPEGWFATIGAQRVPGVPPATARWLEARLREHRQWARDRDERPPGTAEYLDALQAVAMLQLTEGAAAGADAGTLAALQQLQACVFGKQAALGGTAP